MGEFRGGRAAIQSIQFVFNHFSAFLKLTATWAVIATAITIFYCVVTQPAGNGADLAAHIQALGTGNHPLKKLLDVLPNLIGGLSVAVIWIQYVVLAREPRNPLRLPIEMVPYFIRGLGLTAIAVACAVPGAIASLGVAPLLPTPFNRLLMVLGVIVLIALPIIGVYGRLCVVLPAAALDETLTFGNAFERTKGRTVSLTWGLVVAYGIPFLAFMAVAAILALIGESGAKEIDVIGTEIVSNLATFALVIIPAGYLANVYRAFAPGDIAQVAKQFE